MKIKNVQLSLETHGNLLRLQGRIMQQTGKKPNLADIVDALIRQEIENETIVSSWDRPQAGQTRK